eukprot:5344022-Amphidinium_carterae.1
MSTSQASRHAWRLTATGVATKQAAQNARLTDIDCNAIPSRAKLPPGQRGDAFDRSLWLRLGLCFCKLLDAWFSVPC